MTPREPTRWLIERIAATAAAVTTVALAIDIAMIRAGQTSGGFPMDFSLVEIASIVGSALVLAGSWRWYGRLARRMRVVGFIIMVGAGLIEVSFAFILVPLAVLTVFSLGKKRRFDPHHLTRPQQRSSTARRTGKRHRGWRRSFKVARRVQIPQNC